MQCNIDAKGKAARLVGGLILLAVAALLGALVAFDVVAGPWPLAGAIGAGCGGAFMVFEGWSGWCALRALGIRTPL